jgi:urea transport system ATP-binding protein
MRNPIIRTEDVTVEFDGFRALNSLNFVVDEGELRVVIGPNGAGKTTLLDVICGQVRPVSGRVVFKQKDITGLPEYQISSLGIGRKFQTPSVFDNLTPYENMELSWHQNKRVFQSLFASVSPSTHEQILGVLDHVGLAEKAYQPAGSLSHGEKQWLEIGMVIVQDPDLLLIDEPVAGMTDDETEKTAQLLLSIAQDQTILVIEHDMDFVKQIAQKVTVLHEGALLCEGTVGEVQQNPQVVQIYLGRARQANAQANAQG